MCKKIKFWKFWKRPLFDISEHAFKICYWSFVVILNWETTPLKIWIACRIRSFQLPNKYTKQLPIALGWKAFDHLFVSTMLNQQIIWLQSQTRYLRDLSWQYLCVISQHSVAIGFCDLLIDVVVQTKSRRKIRCVLCLPDVMHVYGIYAFVPTRTCRLHLKHTPWANTHTQI